MIKSHLRVSAARYAAVAPAAVVPADVSREVQPPQGQQQQESRRWCRQVAPNRYLGTGIESHEPNQNEGWVPNQLIRDG